jgi:hypothetical protein
MSALPPPVVLPSSPPAEPESLEQLLGDCRRTAARWKAPAHRDRPRVVPSDLHGVSVPPASAHVVEGMAEYGG